jgi:BMFP domain-containing protein YqiC
MADEIKSITDEPLQNQLVKEFFDSRYFGDQHWFAAREEIKALWARIHALESQIEGANKPVRSKRTEVNNAV